MNKLAQLQLYIITGIIFLIIFIFIPTSNEGEVNTLTHNRFKRGDMVHFDGKSAVITDFGSATDWEIKLVDCATLYQDCYLNVNEGDLTK